MTQKIHEYLGSIEDKSIYAKSGRLSSDSFIGLELELEGFSPEDIDASLLDRFFWNVSYDESLRNGVELKFGRPLKEANVDKALSNLEDALVALKESNYHIELSKRTSTHVHVDIRDLSVRDIKQFIFVYTLIEPFFFSQVSPERLKNNYCKPIVGSTFHGLVKELMSLNDSNFVSSLSNNCEKYSAFNIRTVSYFGSIEFRHHQGTVDINKLYHWINLILQLKTYIKNTNNASERLLHLSVKERLKLIFPEEFFQDLEEGPYIKAFNYIKDIIQGTTGLPFHSIGRTYTLKENSIFSKYLNNKGIK